MREAAGIAGVGRGQGQRVDDEGVLGRAVAPVVVVDLVDIDTAGHSVAVGAPFLDAQVQAGHPEMVLHLVPARGTVVDVKAVSVLDIPALGPEIQRVHPAGAHLHVVDSGLIAPFMLHPGVQDAVGRRGAGHDVAIHVNVRGDGHHVHTLHHALAIVHRHRVARHQGVVVKVQRVAGRAFPPRTGGRRAAGDLL